jgi:hypothetical protein
LAIVTSEPVDVSVKVITEGVPLYWLAVKLGTKGILLKFYPNIRKI